MSSAIDFDGIKRAALAQARTLVPAWFPQGKPEGREWVLGSIHGEPGESFKVNMDTGMWGDFADGAVRGNDLIGLYAAMKGIGQGDAARAVNLICGGSAPLAAGNVVMLPAKAREAPSPEDWVPICPVPDGVVHTIQPHSKHGMPTHVARYMDRAGQTIGFIYRCEPEGGKQIVSRTYCRNTVTGAQGWRWKSLPKPRSLYGAEKLDRFPEARVLVVEGEPKCDAAAAMLEDDALIVLAWAGGAQACVYADWTMLRGRKVIVWPDNDTPGKTAAAEIVIALRDHGDVRVVDLPTDLPKGWDLGDAEKDGVSVGWIMAHIDPAPETVESWDEPAEDPSHSPNEAFFKELGHDRGRFYFFTRRGGQVRDFSSRDLQTVGSLLELAPLGYWEAYYPTKGASSFGVQSAGNELVKGCYDAGIFDPGKIRGRGAWHDEHRSILHLGTHLLIDGVRAPLTVPKSKFFYEHTPEMDMELGEPLSSAEADRFRELCVACPWDQPAHMGQMLAGWCVIAPICGAMVWRPHLWLSSESGGGKSWVMENIVQPAVGQLALNVQSKTTEAGIRQTLGCDARPVLFDEAETQNDRDRERLQLVLDLARQASSEGGAAIVKGSASGKASLYHIRSCFLFSSINIGMSQAADESRTVTLTLRQDRDVRARTESFTRLQRLRGEVMVQGFGGRLLARTLKLLPIIRTNAGIFASAIAKSGKSRRMGDTYGALMAGAWSLRSTKVATAEQADEIVANTQWVQDAVVKASVEPEWRRAITHLVQHRARVTNANGRTEDIPIGELIETVATGNSQQETPVDAALALNRFGIRVYGSDGGPVLHIANHSSLCQEVFKGTPWAASWLSTMIRAPGAHKNATTARLGGHVTKVFSIPLEVISGRWEG